MLIIFVGKSASDLLKILGDPTTGEKSLLSIFTNQRMNFGIFNRGFSLKIVYYNYGI